MNVRTLIRVGTDSVRGYWQGPMPLRDPNLASYFGWPGAQTAAGISVTESTALTYSAVWAAVSLIAGQVASLPLNLYLRHKGGGKSVMDWNPLHRKLHDEPNDEMSAFEFRETLQLHLLLWGNGYAEIVRNGRGAVSALWPITPDRITPFREKGRLQYRIDGQQIEPAENILHLRGLAFDGSVGYSPISCARQSIALGLSAERFGATFYGNGSTFGGILTHPGKLTKEAKQGIRETIAERHQGPNKAHQFLILGEGMTYAKLGVPPNDAQFLESRKFQVTEVCRWFNLPPHKLRDLERATFSNIEQQTIDFVTDTLRPWLVRWEQAINRALIPSAERSMQFAEHKLTGLLRGDSQARGEFYSKMFSIGVLSVNDILDLENMNGIGADGDRHFVQGALMPLDKIDEQLDAKLTPPPPPALQPADDEDTKSARAAALESLQTIMDWLGVVRDQQAATIEAVQLVPSRVAELPVLAEGPRLVADATVRAEQAEVAARDARAETEQIRAHAQRDTDAARSELEAARALQQETDARVVTEQRAKTEALERVAAASERVLALDADLLTARSLSGEHLTARDAALAALAQAEADVVTHQQARDQAVVDAESARQLTQDATEKLALTETRAAELETAHQASREALATQRQADKDRLSRMLGVHRGLIVDVMGRMVGWETEKARRNQGTPAKLRAWAESFYLVHEDKCVEALLPAVRTHLAWIGSDVDPEQAAREWLRPQLTAAVQTLRNIVDGDPDEYQPLLERVLTKWEQERPAALADRVLQQEIDHVRSL